MEFDEKMTLTDNSNWDRKLHDPACSLGHDPMSSECDIPLQELRRRANNENAGDGSKPSNPKDAVGSKKARWFSYIPLRVLVGVGIAMLEGALKYGRHNYRVAGIRGSVYVDAVVCGHLVPWMEGEDIDPDSGRHHIDKAIASLVVLRDGMLEGNWTDDRPPSAKGFAEFMAQAHKDTEALLAKYPEGKRKAAFTIDDTIWKNAAAARAAIDDIDANNNLRLEDIGNG